MKLRRIFNKEENNYVAFKYFKIEGRLLCFPTQS